MAETVAEVLSEMRWHDSTPPITDLRVWANRIEAALASPGAAVEDEPVAEPFAWAWLGDEEMTSNGTPYRDWHLGFIVPPNRRGEPLYTRAKGKA